MISILKSIIKDLDFWKVVCSEEKGYQVPSSLSQIAVS